VTAVILILAGIALLAGMGWWATQFVPFLRGGQATTALLLEVRPESSPERSGSLTYLYVDPAGEGHQGSYRWTGGKNSHNRLHAGESVTVWFLKDAPDRCYFGEPDSDLRRCLVGAGVGIVLLAAAAAALWEWRRLRRRQVVVVCSFWWVLRP
jgi:hypothetical protein